MNRQIILITILAIIIAIIGKIYLRTWESKKIVKEFLKEEKSKKADLKPNSNDKIINDNLKENSKSIPKEKLLKINNTNKSKNENKLDKIFDNLKPNKVFNIKYKLISKPFILKTHRNRRIHILVQDEKFNIYFLDETNKLIWKKPLGEKITTDIFEIDYLKNGKIQYLFATTKFLYLIDYNGNRVGKYPYELNALQKPEYLNVISYSQKNKNYRISIITKEGSIYLFDKYLKILQGWNPKIFKSSLMEKLIHMRVDKKDYLIVAQKSGEIFLIKRNGNIYINFPINLNDSIKSFMAIKRTNKKTSSLVVLSEKNILYEFDLNGKKKLELKPLLPNENGSLTMIKDEFAYNDYVLLKILSKEIKILDNHGKILLKSNINFNDIIKAKFFNKKNIFIINNESQNKLNVYSGSKLLIQKSIKSKSLFNLTYNKNSNSIKLFNCIENKLETYHIKF